MKHEARASRFEQVERSSYNNDVACPVEAAMQRLRGAEGSPPPDAPRAAFPAQRFPLYAGDDINRQLRDLLQRHPDKMWPPRECPLLAVDTLALAATPSSIH